MSMLNSLCGRKLPLHAQLEALDTHPACFFMPLSLSHAASLTWIDGLQYTAAGTCCVLRIKGYCGYVRWD